jgi:2-succinyl-5-enolpyruvyl-6-hydroxy-3-cyclohexene-1-carboxylate synthase
LKPWLKHIPWLPAICAELGVENAVISPGSRSAPLTIAFVRHPKIKAISVPDERSAAFIALGMAIATKKPTVLICTSGSAVLNYFPAVAEAFYQEVPLLILSADRPAEWIDQWDGQTIRQDFVFGHHVKEFYSLPEDCEEASSLKVAKEMMALAVKMANAYPKGPVHLNVPIAEPFYPAKDEEMIFPTEGFPNVSIGKYNPLVMPDAMLKSILGKGPVMIVAGQEDLNPELQAVLESLNAHEKILVVTDIISNQSGITNSLITQDLMIGKWDQETAMKFKPDVLITFGKSLISKNLKIFLRNHKPQIYYHIAERIKVPNPFKFSQRLVYGRPKAFFSRLVNELPGAKPVSADWKNAWLTRQNKAIQSTREFLETEKYTEIHLAYRILKAIPAYTVLHVANSMAVRYANLLSFVLMDKAVEIIANRGTSGIDGSNSTALGFAMRSEKDVFLWTGDMAFLYDRNAFWHNESYSNLKIIVLNNGGGGIFRLIDGPSAQPELEEWFETRQKGDALHVAQEYGIAYYACRSLNEVDTNLSSFLAHKNAPAIIEIFTDKYSNQETYKAFHSHIWNSL